jgi:hypothetical protein
VAQKRMVTAHLVGKMNHNFYRRKNARAEMMQIRRERIAECLGTLRYFKRTRGTSQKIETGLQHWTWLRNIFRDEE